MGRIPATKIGKANHPWPAEHPKRAPGWVPVYGVTSVFLAGMPIFALMAGIALIGWWIRDTDTLASAVLQSLIMLPVATILSLLVFAVITLVAVRLLSIGLTPVTTLSAAASAGRCGRPNACSTRPEPSSSRSTRAC
ncbi:hypothetical protein GCM10020255_047380 [Rhodococcus baikonurensis]